MISPRQPTPPLARPNLNLRLQACAWGLCILLAGLGTAAWLWHTANSRHDEDLSTLGLALAPEDSARYQRDVELYSGKLGVLMDRWTREAGVIVHSKPFALALGALSVLAAGACFAFAARQRSAKMDARPE